MCIVQDENTLHVVISYIHIVQMIIQPPIIRAATIIPYGIFEIVIEEAEDNRIIQLLNLSLTSRWNAPCTSPS